MRLKKLISLLTSVTMVFAMNSYPIVFAESEKVEIPEITPESKISDDLKEHFEADPTGVYPVVMWFENISDTEVETKIENEIGYDIASVEVDYDTPSNELIGELQRAAISDPDENLEYLMQKYMQLTEDSRKAERKRVDAYRSARLDIVEDMITSKTASYLKELAVADESVLFVSHYAPMSVCLLTQDEIITASKNDKVEELTLYEPMKVEECTINLGTTTSTMGIERINNTLSLTGNNVTIGFYESGTLSSSYYAAYGINSSHVTIIGSSYSSGYHSTYCAGIAAGNNGVAPAANIYSASSHYDHSTFNWTNYSSAQLSNLESMIVAGANIISMSWHWTGQGNIYNNYAKYVDYLISNTGITIVCASGNDSSQYLGAPGTAYNAITVNGFIDQYDDQARNILNDYAYKHGSGCLKPDVVGPSLNSGTSIATPYIAGMIALMYEYKPSLKVMPETTKAILISSCHEKCSKLLVGNTLYDLSETMTAGLTDRQGAGIPNVYRMISTVSQHSYGNGVLNTDNDYERYVHFTQPKYNSSYINVAMAYLQTNIPSDTTSGEKDDCDISVTNNATTKTSTHGTSSTEMVYRTTSSDSSYSMRIYRFSGQSNQIKYGYAWSTDTDVYHPSIEMDGMYMLQNYNSNLYLSLNSSNSRAYQTSYENIVNGNWIMNITSVNNSTYWMKNSSTNNNGLGQGDSISNNNYYAVDSSTSASTPITLQFNTDTGTYTIKRTINGSTYALGISNNSTATGAYANWQPYSVNNRSQKWYLETVNNGPGDVNLDGTINNTDKTLLDQSLIGAVVFTNNMQKYMADVNRDGCIDTTDALFLLKIINGII